MCVSKCVAVVPCLLLNGSMYCSFSDLESLVTGHILILHSLLLSQEEMCWASVNAVTDSSCDHKITMDQITFGVIALFAVWIIGLICGWYTNNKCAKRADPTIDESTTSTPFKL